MKYDLCKLVENVPEREMTPNDYDNMRAEQDRIFKCFKASYDIMCVEAYKNRFADVSVLRETVPMNSYENLKICGKNVSEVGCGIITTVQAMADSDEIVKEEQVAQIVKIMESKAYYYVGRGLYWHWFNFFTSRVNHWYGMLQALKEGCVVTVLVKYPEKTRNHFMNLIGSKMENGTIRFITTDGTITLERLMQCIVTAPWKWDK